MNSEAKQAYKEYMKEYMKKYRNTEKGKKICKDAKERYYTKKFNERKKEDLIWEKMIYRSTYFLNLLLDHLQWHFVKYRRKV